MADVLKPYELDKKREGIRTLLARIKMEGYVTLGHGTREEAAKKIMKEGLKCQSSMLESTLIALFSPEKGVEITDEEVERVLNGQHLDSKYIVIVQIRNPEERKNARREYFQQIIEKLPDEQKGMYGNINVVPRAFIRGYIDVEKSKFIENENFDPNIKLKPLITNNPTAIDTEITETREEVSSIFSNSTDSEPW